jgi:AhpD family alkylhydroperoxidase
MEARFNLHDTEHGRRFHEKLRAVGKTLADSALPHSIQELVKIRASQINGCGFCTDMHTKEAAAAGETQQRLNLVAVWREADVFDEAERAAFALTEEGTRIADAATGVAAEAWEGAREHYDDEQLAALITLIALINAYNRMGVIAGVLGGGYRLGQFG